MTREGTPTRRGGRSLVVAVAAVIVVLGASGAIIASARTVARGRLQRIAPPANVGDGLNGVSCVTTRWCMGVGQTQPGNDAAVIWTGQRWHAVSPPSSPYADYQNRGFASVSCPTTRDCVAVGEDSGGDNTVQRWNGSTWTRETADPKLAEGAVSCAGPSFCMAVGEGVEIRQADGTWSVLPRSAGGSDNFDAVSCLSATFCAAAGGGHENSQVATWNGRRLAVVNERDATAQIPGLNMNAVSCTSDRDCVAVGGTSEDNGATAIITARWNGRRWRHAQRDYPRGRGGDPIAISCTRSGGCLAVGFPLGRDWITSGDYLVPLASGVKDESPSNFSAVSCVGPRFCMVTQVADSGVAVRR